MNQQYRNAIGTVESDNDYGALGPVTDSGDRAYGRYQVMGANVPEWTQTYLGQRLTPEEFLANPKAQDAVFDAHTKKAYAKYGNLDDVTSTWFSGRPMAQAGNASDGYNTTPQYIAKVNKNLDGVGAINKAIGAPSDPGVLTSAFAAPDKSGALSADETLGPGLLFRGTKGGEVNTANVLGQGLTGIGAALAGISSPAQAQSLVNQGAAMQKQVADNGWTIGHVDPKTGMALVTRKDGTVARVKAFDAQPEKGDETWMNQRAKANSDLYDKIGQDATDAVTGMQNVQNMRAALSDPNVYQGNGGSAFAKVRGYMKSLGIPGIEGVENSQIAESLHNQLTLAARKVDGMPGSLSDSDRNFLSAIAPGLDNRPETNAQLLGYMEKMYQRRAEMVKLRDEYVAEHGKLDDGFSKQVASYVKEHNLFPDASKAPSATNGLPKGVRSIQVITQ